MMVAPGWKSANPKNREIGCNQNDVWYDRYRIERYSLTIVVQCSNCPSPRPWQKRRHISQTNARTSKTKKTQNKIPILMNINIKGRMRMEDNKSIFGRFMGPFHRYVPFRDDDGFSVWLLSNCIFTNTMIKRNCLCFGALSTHFTQSVYNFDSLWFWTLKDLIRLSSSFWESLQNY